MEPARMETDASTEGAVLHRDTMLRGCKPLHRFIKGQPKIFGVVLLLLGSSFFIVAIILREIPIDRIGLFSQPGFWLGPLLIVCGIVYILAEYNPTKKIVTASLAVSIVALLSSAWVAFLSLLPGLIFPFFNEGEHFMMVRGMYLVFMVYIVAVVIILITMSVLAGASLRSSRNQAQIVMTKSQPSTE